MLPEEKKWHEQHGTPEEKQFVAKYGDRKVTAGSLLKSVGVMVLMAAGVFIVLAGYLYISRVLLLRPVTGAWVGTMSSGEGVADRRVVYVDTSVSFLRWSSPTLTGKVRMCDKQGETQFALQKTRTVSADTLGITLISTETSDGGELFGALRGDHLASQYDSTDPGLQGELHRDNLQAYRQACLGLRQ